MTKEHLTLILNHIISSKVPFQHNGFDGFPSELFLAAPVVSHTSWVFEVFANEQNDQMEKKKALKINTSKTNAFSLTRHHALANCMNGQNIESDSSMCSGIHYRRVVDESLLRYLT